MCRSFRHIAAAVCFCFAILVIGCGGIGNLPSPYSSLPHHYVVDPSVTPFSSQFTVTGVGPKGEWLGIAVVPGDLRHTGFVVDGVFTAMPQRGLPSGAVATPVCAGGRYVWATYTTPMSQPFNQAGIEIYDRYTQQATIVSTGFIVYSLTVSPDGASAFVLSPGSPYLTFQVTYGFMTASGSITPFTMPHGYGGIIPAAYSSAGYVVGTVGILSNPPASAQISTKQTSWMAQTKNQTNSDPYAVVKSDGSVTVLQGLRPYPYSINAKGETCGWDFTAQNIEIAAKWDRFGRETLLKQFNANNQESASEITQDGFVIGSDDDPKTGNAFALIWAPDGSVSTIDSKLEPTKGLGQALFGYAIQSPRKVLVTTYDSGSYYTVVGLIGAY